MNLIVKCSEHDKALQIADENATTHYREVAVTLSVVPCSMCKDEHKAALHEAVTDAVEAEREKGAQL